MNNCISDVTENLSEADSRYPLWWPNLALPGIFPECVQIIFLKYHWVWQKKSLRHFTVTQEKPDWDLLAPRPLLSTIVLPTFISVAKVFCIYFCVCVRLYVRVCTLWAHSFHPSTSRYLTRQLGIARFGWIGMSPCHKCKKVLYAMGTCLLTRHNYECVALFQGSQHTPGTQYNDVCTWFGFRGVSARPVPSNGVCMCFCFRGVSARPVPSNGVCMCRHGQVYIYDYITETE